MALSASALSELLDVLRVGDGTDLVRDFLCSAVFAVGLLSGAPGALHVMVAVHQTVPIPGPTCRSLRGVQPAPEVPAPLLAGPPGHRGVAAVSVALSVPKGIVSNAQIAARLGLDEEWLARRTGTKERHVAAEGERLEQFAADAAGQALERAGILPGDVDAVLVGTTCTEEMSPHAAPMVAADIGARGAAAIDVSAACVGFLSCLALGSAMVESGRARTVVAVGADIVSRYVDPDDPQTAMVFGDGAGAVVLTATSGPTRVGPSVLRSDGDGRGLIRLDRDERHIHMDGQSVFHSSVRSLSEVSLEAAARAGVGLEAIDLFVFHQANSRIIDAVRRRLEVDEQRVVDVVGSFANTAAGSVPIALAVAESQGRLHRGDRVLLAAFGAGLVWGGVVLMWGLPASE